MSQAFRQAGEQADFCPIEIDGADEAVAKRMTQCLGPDPVRDVQVPTPDCERRPPCRARLLGDGG